MKKKYTSPYALDEYFASGYEESENPFIKEGSRPWGKHVALLSAVSAAIFLLFAYIAKFYSFNIESFFLVLVYFLAGTPSLIVSLKNLQKLNVNIQVLMTLGALLSVLIGSQLEGGLLLVLFALSEALEESVAKKTKGALNALHKIAPTTAYVINDTDNTVHAKSVREIELDTKILVKAGEIIPLDGLVIEGSSFVNLAHLTGESVPIAKKVGNEVQAGSLNTDGTLTISVTKTSAESTLAKIIQLITEAHEAKPQIQKILDRFGRRYATTVILLAFNFALFLPFIFPSIPFIGNEGSIYRALAFLIAASPCALIIATPTAYLSAISACARKGVLLKGGIVLDALAKCKKLGFDKTGTLTTGKLTCSSVDIDGNTMNLEEGIAIAAGLERAVVHPIAEAVLKYAQEKKINQVAITDMKVIPGHGVEGYVTISENRNYAVIGNVDFILEKISDPSRVKSIINMVKRAGHVVTLLLVNDTVLIFHFLDELRRDVKTVIKDLEKEIEVAMLTGDHVENANYVAKTLGIKEIYSDLKPQDKLRIVNDLAEKYPLVMVGDGINDAPALTRAMVGIAMGEIGSATAINAADIVLLRDDLSTLSWLIKKSKKTISIVKQNLTLSISIIILNALFSILGFIPLWLAVILHEGSTVAVGLNSMRLLRK